MTAAERFRFAHDEALEAALVTIDTDDETQAAVEVSQAVADARAAGIQALALAVVVEAKSRARDVEREAAKAKADVARREAIERDGRKALDKVFGKLGAKVSVFESYTIVDVNKEGELSAELVLALPTRELDNYRTGLRAVGVLSPGYERKSVVGYQLAKAVEPEELNAVCSEAAEAVELVRAAHAAALERNEADRARKAEESAVVRRDAEQKKLYGTVI